MAWEIRSTYLYLVCFATLMMVIVGTVMTVRNALDLALPTEPYRPTPVELYERTRVHPGVHPGAVEPAPFTREELQQMADEEAERMRREQRRSDVRDLLGSLALLLIAAPVYLYHWRLLRT